ncbi:unnamed protein product [Ceratitis capitata]|uniref:(Mediterranean fruit fly) hypothetical protein n=1 Tax=Ceratitis capitata TaxID=7213 RepID=A0A811UAL5_CERCA|nr:unnamed protein product [Ceratitis capitata]
MQCIHTRIYVCTYILHIFLNSVLYMSECDTRPPTTQNINVPAVFATSARAQISNCLSRCKNEIRNMYSHVCVCGVCVCLRGGSSKSNQYLTLSPLLRQPHQWSFLQLIYMYTHTYVHAQICVCVCVYT